MPNKLPTGWVKTTLGEVCLPVSTIQPEDSPEKEFTYFDIGGIDNQSHRIAETKTVTGRDAPSRARQSVQKDDILFSTVRTYLKKIAQIERDYPNPVASTGFTVIRAAEGVFPQFLFSQILSEDFLQPLHKLQSGSSYPAVRDKDVFAQPIRLAPTREQERIVAKLDALLSRLSAGEAAARRALDRLQRYRAAVLHAAVTGELTEAWRKTHQPEETGHQLLQRLLKTRRARWEEAEINRLHAAGKPPKDDEWKLRYREPIRPHTTGLPELPKGWMWASLDQITTDSLIGLDRGRSAQFTTPPGTPYIKMNNITLNGDVTMDDLVCVHATALEIARFGVLDGDVLFNTRNSRELVGKTGLVCNPPNPSVYNNNLMRLRFETGVLPAFVCGQMCSSHFRARLELKKKATTNVAAIYGKDLFPLAIALPATDEQTQIVSEVEHRLSAADRLADSLNRQLDRVCTTRQSLLRAAFTGKLVPQLAGDESAAALLDRIRAARTGHRKSEKK
jgi:type I restriction enzyme, S subunit